MSDDFAPDQFTDEYQIELKRLLDDAIASGTGKVPEQPEAVPSAMDAEVVDLVAALQRSLEASGRRSAGAETPEKGEPKKAAKKTASKSAASKSATKKAPAKKTAKKSAARKGA